MDHIVLSRKYRPTILSDLIGQNILVSALQKAIDSQRIPHAFIFHGIRGIGKTTVARILARSLNCETGITSAPCGVCKSCKAMDIDNHLDVMEIDAASRTGVDDIREIIDATQYVPIMSRFKIFIIDEVHMLSKSAFNALLKTLEEPPAHVKFMFATTEVRKVPDTILSRCMSFNLKPVSIETIGEHLIKIASLEHIKLNEDAAKLLATESEGSVRDSLSNLEQAMLLSIGDSNGITVNTISGMLGGAKTQDTEQLLTLILDAKTKEALTLGNNLIQNKGADPYIIYKNLQNVLYTTIINKVQNNQSVKYKLSNLLYIWQIFLKQLQNIKNAPYPEQVLNATIIIMAHTASLPDIEKLAIRDDADEGEPELNNNTTDDFIGNILRMFPGSTVSEVE